METETATKTLAGCVVIVDKGALGASDKKKLEQLGATVIEKDGGATVDFVWAPTREV